LSFRIIPNGDFNIFASYLYLTLKERKEKAIINDRKNKGVSWDKDKNSLGALDSIRILSPE
jgi:hypothetical protein